MAKQLTGPGMPITEQDNLIRSGQPVLPTNRLIRVGGQLVTQQQPGSPTQVVSGGGGSSADTIVMSSDLPQAVAVTGLAGSDPRYNPSDHVHPDRLTGIVAGSGGDSTHSLTLTWDANGRLTAAVNVAIAFPKRRWIVPFPQNGATLGIDKDTVEMAPAGLANASITWVLKNAWLRTETPAVAATTIMAIVSTVTNAALGSGSNLLSGNLTQSGATNFETSTTSFTGTTVASGNKVAINWVAAGGSDSMVTLEFEEQ